jgi:protein-disulfide isomerase
MRSNNASTFRTMIVILALIIFAAAAAIGYSVLSGGTAELDYSQYQQSVDTTEGLGAVGYTLGDPNAPVTIVEYADFACPLCYQLKGEMEAIIQEYVADGQARFVYKVVTFMSSASVPAGAAAHCAGQQGYFWPMYEQVWNVFATSGPSALNETVLTQRAQRVDGLSMSAFRQCLTAPSTEAALNDISQEAVRREVERPPAVFVNGQRVTLGANPQADIAAAIEAALNNQ